MKAGLRTGFRVAGRRPDHHGYHHGAGPLGCSFGYIAAHEVPFTEAQLQDLYPNHGAYVSAVANDVNRLVIGRFITCADGTLRAMDAAKADMP